MDEHIYSISGAYEKYIAAANAVLDAYHFAGGLQTEVTRQAMEKLAEQRQHLISACDNAEASIHMMIQRVWEFEVAHCIEAIGPVMKNLRRMHKVLMLFSLSCKTLTSCFNLITHQVRILEAAARTNAAELTPVRPANAERRQPNTALIHLEDNTRDGGAARATGERNMDVSPVLSDINLNRWLIHRRLLSELDPKNTN